MLADATALSTVEPSPGELVPWSVKSCRIIQNGHIQTPPMTWGVPYSTVIVLGLPSPISPDLKCRGSAKGGAPVRSDRLWISCVGDKASYPNLRAYAGNYYRTLCGP